MRVEFSPYLAVIQYRTVEVHPLNCQLSRVPGKNSYSSCFTITITMFIFR